MATTSEQSVTTSAETESPAMKFYNAFFTSGFPYLRFYDPLLIEETYGPAAETEEQLLAAMHCRDEQLLVITNKNIVVYKLPRHKGFLERMGPEAVKFGLGFVPGVGELIEGVDKIGEATEKVKTVGGWVTRKKRKEKDHQAEAEGMPTSEMIEHLAFDFKKPEDLNLALDLKHRILLENALKWKTEYRASLVAEPNTPVEITMDKSGVKIDVGKRRKQVTPAGKDWTLQNIVEVLMLFIQDSLKNLGWAVESSEQKLVLRRG